MLKDMLHNLPDGRDIEELMREKAKHTMTTDELREQRVSWVMGMLPREGSMSTEQVEEFIRGRYG